MVKPNATVNPSEKGPEISAGKASAGQVGSVSGGQLVQHVGPQQGLDGVVAE